MFSFLLGIPRSGFAGSKVNMFNLLRNCRTFPTWLHHFTFPLAMYECSNFSTSLSTLVTIYLFYYNHSTGFYCGFKNKFIYLFIFLFIYLQLCQIFVAVRGLSLVAVSGGYSLLRCAGFSLSCFLLLQSVGSRHAGFSSCGTWARQLWLAGSRAQAQQLWHTGLVAPWHVGSSRTRARTRVPCIGTWILNHCATREALYCGFDLYFPDG